MIDIIKEIPLDVDDCNGYYKIIIYIELETKEVVIHKFHSKNSNFDEITKIKI